MPPAETVIPNSSRASGCRDFQTCGLADPQKCCRWNQWQAWLRYGDTGCADGTFFSCRTPEAYSCTDAISMRFPYSLAFSLARYLIANRRAARDRFPLVLMLEPLHGCNLCCAGCGRVREYADTRGQILSVQQCLTAVDDCGAPVVSICGGEPLIYPHLDELLGALLRRGKHIYLCTNGLLLQQWVNRLPRDRRLMINVHLDGMERTHDAIVQRQGVFKAATAGIRAARQAGLLVYTNTTIYRQTDMHEIVVLLAYLEQLGVAGMMISPGYDYPCTQPPAGSDEAGMALRRAEIHDKFRQVRHLLESFPLVASPLYLDFLCGQCELTCAAWANPTYNVRGWRSPCYQIGQTHYPTYREFIEAADFDRYGPGRDPLCQDCLTHCGFEPAAMLVANARPRELLRMVAWQLG